MAPWRRIAKVRDVVAHRYLQVDYEIIWGVVINTLLDFKASVLKYGIKQSNAK